MSGEVKEVINKFTELEQARNNVKYLLKHPNELIGLHSLSHWASRVEGLYNEIEEMGNE